MSKAVYQRISIMYGISVKPFQSGCLLRWDENYSLTREDLISEVMTKNLLAPGVVCRLAWSGYSIFVTENDTVLLLGNKTGKPCGKYVLSSELEETSLDANEGRLQFTIP
jgi:hypothetical protein